LTPLKIYRRGQSTGVGRGGYAWDLTPQRFMWDIDMYIPLEKSNT